jgi:hypothetical protein
MDVPRTSVCADSRERPVADRPRRDRRARGSRQPHHQVHSSAASVSVEATGRETASWVGRNGIQRQAVTGKHRCWSAAGNPQIMPRRMRHPVRNRTLVDQPRRPVALLFAPMFLDPLALLDGCGRYRLIGDHSEKWHQ